MGSTAVDKAKEAALISSIERTARLAKWNAYGGFAVITFVGFCALMTGAMGLVAPTILPLRLQLIQPEAALGLGLALVAGNKVVTLLAKITNVLR